MNGHFKGLFSEITSVFWAILQFFYYSHVATKKPWYAGPIYALYMIYSLPTKSYPAPNGKRSFLCKCYNRISIKTGLRRLNWVVSLQYHQQTRNAAQFWATEVFELTKIICKKPRKLAINLYRKLTTYAKDLHFSRTYSRIVDVRGDMIPYSLKSNRKWFFRHLLHIFHSFSVSFLPVLYTVVNYPYTWFTGSF